MFSAIVNSILVGRLITRVGRYKGFVLAGLIVMGVGYYLLTRLGYGSTQTDLTVAMVVLGPDLRPHRPERDLARGPRYRRIDHAAHPLDGRHVRHRHGQQDEDRDPQARASRSPEQFAGQPILGWKRGRGVARPERLRSTPPAVETGIREGLAAAMYPVFLVGLLIIGIVLAASIFIKELPLRDTAFADEDAGERILAEPNRSAIEGAFAPDRSDERKTHERKP